MTTTTIQLSKDLVESMKEIKEYPRQTYNELIEHMIKIFSDIKRKNQYPKILSKNRKA